MNSFNKSQSRRTNKDDVSEIETLISQVLAPVKPRDEFIDELRYRLTHKDMEILKQGNLMQPLIFLIVGLFGGLLVIVGAIKAFLSLVQAIKLVKKRSQIRDTMVSME